MAEGKFSAALNHQNPSRVLKKASYRLLKKIQMRGARKTTSGGVLTVRCSEAIERQRSIWVLFSSLLAYSPKVGMVEMNVPRHLRIF